MQVLDIGCGGNKVKGAIGIDRVELPGVDIVWDLNSFPYPLSDSTFDDIYAIHVIEHVDSVVKVMEEIHRLAKPNAKIVIITPHHSDMSSWTDPTHKWHLTTYSLDCFDLDHEANYSTKARFKTESIRIEMARLWRAMGIQSLINYSLSHKSLRCIRKFWEGYLSLIMRGGAMTFVLRAVKMIGQENKLETSR